jgi:hypothetical protein
MSCHPGTPCYNNNNNNNTTADPCIAANSSSCEGVLYYGPALPNTGIDNLDNLCVAFQKVDAAIANSSAGSITANNGLTKTGNNIALGGQLIENTTINTNGNSLFVTNLPLEVATPDFILTQTSTGIVRKVAATGLGQSITLQNNVGLVWTNPEETNLSTLYNTLINSATVSVQVGGAAPNTAANWSQLTLVQVLDAILFPLRLPTYIVPTVTMTLTPTPATYYEIGAVVSIAATGVGTRWDGGAFASMTLLKSINSGIPSQTTYSSFTVTTLSAFGSEFGFADPNSPNISYTSPQYTETLTIPAPTTGQAISTVLYQFTGSYGAGLPKLNSNGVADTRTAGNTVNTPQAAGSTSSSSVTFNGIYPIFWGTASTQLSPAQIASAIVGGTANKILLPASGTITVPYNNSSSLYLWVAYLAVNTTKTKWFNTTLNQGNIGTVTDLFGAVQTVNVTSPDAYWSGISFKTHVSNFTTIVNGNIEFRNA